MKKSAFIFFLSVSFSLLSFAQYEVTIDAQLLDQQTKKPISYANIGFFEKSIGTVSDSNGEFQLIYNDEQISGADKLQISALGYKTLQLNKKELEKYLLNTNKIYLNPEPFVLEEVVINNDRKVQQRIGSFELNNNIMGYWKDAKALGGEIASKIIIRNENTQLLDLKFNIIENASDSLKVRVNIYNYKDRYPGDKLNSQNIYYTIKIKSGVETIDLKPYDIYVNNDIIVSIELLKVYGDKIGLAISGRDQGSTNSFLRYISQDKWKRINSVGINFSLLTSKTVNAKEAEKLKRPNPNRITIYWDTSLSMKDKMVANELDLLNNYLKKLGKIEVEVVTFNLGKLNRKMFLLNRASRKEIIAHLNNQDFHGASDYSNILKANSFNSDMILLFSDGETSFAPLEQEINTPVFIINSKSQVNNLALQKVAFYADGYYINLLDNSKKEALNILLFQKEDTNIYSNEKSEKTVVKGKVTSENLTLQGASVSIKGTYISTHTDYNGEFSLNLIQGETVLVSHLGMKSKEVLVDGNQLNIILEPDTELLEEILIYTEKNNSNLIETPFGDKKEESIGYSNKVVTSKEISADMVYLADLIRRRFTLVRVVGSGVDARFFVRGNGEPAFVVDGVVFREPPNFLNLNNIETITLIGTLIGSVKYGSIGADGAFVIKTKNNLSNKKEKKIDNLLVQGNDYNELLPLLNSIPKTSQFIEELNLASSYEQALNIYYRLLAKKKLRSIPFYFDVSDYFLKWNKDKSLEILSNIAEIAPNNVKALKALAYKLETRGSLENAKHLYERIKNLRPSDAQSYRDLALIYSKVGMYEEAMDIYKSILSKSIDQVDFTGIGEVIENELKAFLNKHRVHVSYKDLPSEFLNAKFKKDFRIVLEWNDPSVEFDMQFVNPQKKYFTWSHTLFDNKERLLDEVKKGYHTQEFVIDDASPGYWIINIECLSTEPPLNPTFLKYTVYKNYGLSNETSEVKVIKLYDQKQKVTLDKFFYK